MPKETLQLLQLNITDYIIIAVLFMSILVSFMRGLVKECISLSIWIVGFWTAIKFNLVIANMLTPYISSASFRIVTSFVVIVIAILILGAICNFLLSFVISKSGLGGFDRILGMLFGSARGLLLVAVFLLLVSTTSLVNDSWWQESVFIPKLNFIVDWLREFLPNKISNVVATVN
jgi:membrane protein required for colicin V production